MNRKVTQKHITSIHELANWVERDEDGNDAAAYGATTFDDDCTSPFGKKTIIFGRPCGFDHQSDPVEWRRPENILRRLRLLLQTRGILELAFSVDSEKLSWAMLVDTSDTEAMRKLILDVAWGAEEVRNELAELAIQEGDNWKKAMRAKKITRKTDTTRTSA